MKWLRILFLGVLGVAITVVGCTRLSNQSTDLRNQGLLASLPTPLPTPTTKSAKPIQAEQIDKTWSSKFKFDTKSIEKKHERIRGYEISVEYPQIEGTRAVSTQRFNRWIRKKIIGYVAQFRGLEQSAEIDDRKKRLPPLNINESLGIGYLIYYSDGRLISMRLTHTVMAIGQMHPIDYYETINYDLRKGREFQPSEVFKPGFLRALSRYSRDELQRKYDLQYTNDEWVSGGTAPRKHNFKNWNVVPDGILLSFEDYQIAAHAFGQAEIIIPFSALKQVLRRATIASRFIKPT